METLATAATGQKLTAEFLKTASEFVEAYMRDPTFKSSKRRKPSP